MKIIAIAGRKRSGKNTLADQIREHLPGTRIKYIAFADPLKDAVMEKLNIDNREMLDEFKNDDEILLHGKCVRKHITDTSDELKKIHGSRVFISETNNRINDIINSGDTDLLMITDVRYLMEEEYCRSVLGALIIKLERDHANTDTHKSETEVDEIKADITISNNGTRDDLYNLTASYVMCKIREFVSERNITLSPHWVDSSLNKACRGNIIC